MFNFLFHPKLFFESRLLRRPNWVLALASPAVCAVLQFVSLFIFSSKMELVLDGLSRYLHLETVGVDEAMLITSLLGSASYIISFFFIGGAVICLDIILKDSRRSLRLLECVGLSFVSQVPYGVLMVVVAYFWSPPQMAMPVSASPRDIDAALLDYHRTIFSWAPLAASRPIAYYSVGWLMILVGIALKVVSGLSTRAVVLACTLFIALFVLIRFA